jgi:adenylate cyclase
MPPLPWINASVRRPLVAAEIPMARKDTLDRVSKRYLDGARSKALVVAPNGTLYWTFGQISPEEAMRRSLERCGYLSSAACLVVAVDDSFVVPAPTLAKAVGFYHSDALSSAQPGERVEVARRLSNAPPGWSAVAVGVTGRAGTKAGAISERSAVEGALENCAIHDRDCRIAVIGPFLVEVSPRNSGAPLGTGGTEGFTSFQK